MARSPPQHRQSLVAGRMLALPDGTWWVFGAWGRWYRWTPDAGQWHLCPPPQLTITRMSARPLQPGMPVPQIPPHLVPAGPDLAYAPPPAAAFADIGIRPEVTSRVRSTVESAAALPLPDYPHWWNLFSAGRPAPSSSRGASCCGRATAPIFDARLDAQLLGLWSPYRARPLPRDRRAPMADPASAGDTDRAVRRAAPRRPGRLRRRHLAHHVGDGQRAARRPSSSNARTP